MQLYLFIFLVTVTFMNMQNAIHCNHCQWIRMEAASSRPDHPPTLSAAKTSELSLLVKLTFWWRSGRFRQCYSDLGVSEPTVSKLSTLTVKSWWWWWCRPHPLREHAQDLRPPLGARPASPPTRQAAQPPPRGSSTNPRPLA